jgi:tetratricopeptide (TPR) repeat protein
MEPERIRQLEQYIEEDPTDPFNHYALALEYINADKRKAMSLFMNLVTAHEEYLPVYYQLGKLYEALNEPQQAIHYYTKGVALAHRKNDVKTLRELRAALQELEVDED